MNHRPYPKVDRATHQLDRHRSGQHTTSPVITMASFDVFLAAADSIRAALVDSTGAPLLGPDWGSPAQQDPA